LTSKIEEDDLAAEAQKLRYRVVIVYGPRTVVKRDRDVDDERDVKRLRREVIELSSDGEETRELPDTTPTAHPRGIFSDSDGDVTPSEESDEYGNFDAVEVGPSTSTSGPSGTTNTSQSSYKGKGKEVAVDPILDLLDELECFICCTSLRND
jgi:hypothetical protein